LVKELEIANSKRDESPWLVIGTHHAAYCSGNEDDCVEGAANIREGVRPVGSPEDTPRQHSLEKLFYTAGVDLVIYGHVHNYERYFDMTPRWNATDPVSSGVSSLSTWNPPAPLYITTGAAGNVERLIRFKYPYREAIAYRKAVYSWTNMQVFNATHIRWQQVQTDNTQPPEEMGQVIDDAWFIQEHHGPRTEAPLGGRPAQVAAARQASRQAPAGARTGQPLEGLEAFAATTTGTPGLGDTHCRRMRGGLSCADGIFEKAGARLGTWTASAAAARSEALQEAVVVI